ncbi:hypothetical protein Zmor_023602 [Zophobas morio]|uniref:HRDC domain-containing protein n=1 Tax=Zophobas morio TaxID=2755281 RepID=A0AA38HX86_9CUCU|nr:hypothetical protein Zmor_023602 [Zophobas morio]
MSELTGGVDVEDAFTVLDEVNEVLEELSNRETSVKNADVSEVVVKEENEDPAEEIQHVNLETIQKEEMNEECDVDMCEEGGDEQQTLQTEDNGAENSVNDDECEGDEEEPCIEQSDTVDDEPTPEFSDEIVKQAEVSGNLDETGNLRGSDVSQYVEEEELEKPEEESEKPESNDTHPYLYIIETFEYEKDQLNLTTVGSVKTLEETPFYMISTRTGLVKLLQSLRNVKEIGLDIVRATKDFAGTICLILISTRDADYCIDALKLHHDLLLLTEIFINPKILKILVRAKFVLTYLQQNLHLYVINIFDIHQVRSALMGAEAEAWTLNSILKSEYNFERGQLKNPDHHRRPLPEAYKTYYRAGPHYFIYIYHDYKNRLILKDADLYKTKLDEFRNMCKIVFSDMNSASYKSLEDELKNHHKCEVELLKKIFDWRATLARKKNLKCEMILPKSGIFSLVKQLPTEDNQITACTKSPHIKGDIEKLKFLINEAKIKHNIRPKKIRNKKGSFLVPMNESPMQGNFQQKRKQLSYQNEVQIKHRRIEHVNGGAKNNFQYKPIKKKVNEKFAFNQNKQKQSPQNKNVRHPNQTSLYQNKNINEKPWMDKQNSRGSFFDNSRDSFNMTTSSKKRSRFQPPNNRYTDTNESDDVNEVFLSPTSVPSSFTFQTNSSRNHAGSNRNNFDRQTHEIMQMGNFASSSRDMRQMSDNDNEQETLFKSLIDLKQVRDNIRLQTENYGGSFKSPKYQGLNTIDHKINNLERRLQQKQSRNRRGNHGGNSNAPYTRRY